MLPAVLPDNEPKSEWSHDDSFSGRPYDEVSAFVHYAYAIGMHTHQFYEINIVLRGSGAHYIADRRLMTQTGDVFVIPPNVRHGYSREGSLDVYHLLVSCLFFERYREETAAIPGFSALFSIEPLLRMDGTTPLNLRLTPDQLANLLPALDTLVETCSLPPDGGRDIEKNALTMALIVRLCRHYTAYAAAPGAGQALPYHRIVRSIELLYAAYDQKLTIDQLAASVYMSRSQYIRTFRRLFHCPPGQYILRFRLQKATERLETTADTIGEIALRTGFCDSSHFIRVFTHAYGVSPAVYRRIHSVS